MIVYVQKWAGSPGGRGDGVSVHTSSASRNKYLDKYWKLVSTSNGHDIAYPVGGYQIKVIDHEHANEDILVNILKGIDWRDHTNNPKYLKNLGEQNE